MELKILEHSDFGEIRTTTDEKGNVLFCGIDVAKALGYLRPRDAVTAHTKGAVKYRSLTNGGMQELSFIYEPDLYRLIIKSKLPTAVEFERWVFEDVLPSLRRHGIYISDELLHDNELLFDTVEQLRQEQEQNKRLVQALTHAKPRLDYLQTILESDCTMTSSQIAADYGISAIKLNRLLHIARVQRKVGGQWILYCDYMNRGLTNSETVAIAYYGFIVRTRWTQRGRLLIHEILADFGITPSGGL